MNDRESNFTLFADRPYLLDPLSQLSQVSDIMHASITILLSHHILVECLVEVLVGEQEQLVFARPLTPYK